MNYRKELPVRPPRIERLPLNAKGYPIPYFVAYVNGQPDFRVIDPEKITRCITKQLCWICGDKLGRWLAFNVGPVSAVLRNSGEPPSHVDCAEYAAQACPFLRLPAAQYRAANLPPTMKDHPEGMRHNPGVAAIYVTDQYYHQGGLLRLGAPIRIAWFSEGRAATRDEVEAGLTLGWPKVIEACDGKREHEQQAEEMRRSFSELWFPGSAA